MDKHFIFRVVLIVLAAFVLFALINYYNSKQSVAKAEKFYQETLDRVAPMGGSSSKLQERFAQQVPAAGVAKDAQQANAVDPAEEDQASMYRAVDFETNKVASDCFPKDRLTADDLLPKDAANAKWAQVNPAGQGDVRDQNFLTAGAMVGIDTVGSSLRNSSLDLRGDPSPNPMGQWPIQNSTIQPDLLRRRLIAESDCGM